VAKRASNSLKDKIEIVRRRDCSDGCKFGDSLRLINVANNAFLRRHLQYKLLNLSGQLLSYRRWKIDYMNSVIRKKLHFLVFFIIFRRA